MILQKNLRIGSNLTKVRGVTSAFGYALTAGTVTLDTRDYMNGSISGHRYSYHMGVSAFATSFGYLFRTGPGALVGVAGMAVEKGYDVFVDLRGPVWSNYGSWIPTSAGSIMQGFGGR